jgi:hypothetical protein
MNAVPLAPPPTATTSTAMRRLSFGAIAGPVLFTVAWLVLGFLSPGYAMFDIEIDEYSAVSQPISGLGLGVTAPYMNAAFVAAGLLMLAGLVGIFRALPATPRARWVAGLLACTPVGLIIDGIFDLESMMLHLLGFAIGIVVPVLGFVVAGAFFRGIPGWRRFGTWLRLGGPLTLALIVLYFATFDPTAAGASHGIAGLTERILVTEVLAWFAAMGWLSLRRGSR